LPTKFASTALGLTVCELGLFGVAGKLVPMEYVMQMHGGSMLMSDSLPAPVLPLALVLALCGAGVLTLFDRRIRRVQQAIAERLRVFFAEPETDALLGAVPPPVPGLSTLFGPAVLSRPPPASWRAP
jgi:hypothetical protein